MKLVSIIMPLFNAEKTILETMESVLNQTYCNWELIICDDNSTDSSCNLVDRLDDVRIKLIHNEFDKGAAGARNTALKYARGEYICFLDSDDIWMEDKISSQLNFMMDNNLDFSYGCYKTFKESIDDIIGCFIPRESLSFHDILRTCDIGCLTVMVKQHIIENAKFPSCKKEDYAFWLILFKNKNIVARRSPGINALYRISNTSISSNKFKEIFRQFKVLRAYSDCNLLMVIFYTSTYCLNGFYKYFFRYRSKKLLRAK